MGARGDTALRCGGAARGCRTKFVCSAAHAVPSPCSSTLCCCSCCQSMYRGRALVRAAPLLRRRGRKRAGAGPQCVGDVIVGCHRHHEAGDNACLATTASATQANTGARARGSSVAACSAQKREVKYCSQPTNLAVQSAALDARDPAPAFTFVGQAGKYCTAGPEGSPFSTHRRHHSRPADRNRHRNHHPAQSHEEICSALVAWAAGRCTSLASLPGQEPGHCRSQPRKTKEALTP